MILKRFTFYSLWAVNKLKESFKPIFSKACHHYYKIRKFLTMKTKLHVDFSSSKCIFIYFPQTDRSNSIRSNQSQSDMIKFSYI